MADQTPVTSRRISRDKLAQVFKTPELLRAFEAVTNDVAEVLPANSQAAADSAAQAAASAQQAISSANAASSAAAAAAQRAQDAQDSADAALNYAQTEPSIEMLRSELQFLRARVAALEARP